jgi:hypothetical protein
MGGMNDDFTITEVDEFPKFEIGQRYLVFLRGGGWKLSPIAGNTMGVYKLYGNLTEDPYIITLSNIPLRGVEDNRLVFANRINADTAKSNAAIQKETILDKKIQQPVNNAQNEKMEKELQFNDKPVNKETGSGDSILAGYDKTLKLSELKTLIGATKAALDKEKYEKFSKFFFIPVASKGMSSVVPNK